MAKAKDPAKQTPIHIPTDGKLRTIPSSAGPVPMTYSAAKKAWTGTVAGKKISVAPGECDDHVVAMKAAIAAAIDSTKAAQAPGE